MNLTAQEFEVINYLDIRKSVPGVASIEGATFLPSEQVREILRRFEQEGYVVAGEMRITEKGEGAASKFRQSELGESERERVAAVCETFDQANAKLKQLVTDWQVRRIGGAQAVNDHTDREYDFGILSRLYDLHRRTESIFSDLLPVIARYSSYQRRLNLAVEKIREGKTEYLSRPSIDSYHTVWFELHEDLLKVTGRKRDE